MPEFDNSLGEMFIVAAPPAHREAVAARHARAIAEGRKQQIWRVSQDHLFFGSNARPRRETRRCVILRLDPSETRYVVRPCTGQENPAFIKLPASDPSKVRWCHGFRGPSWAARNVPGDRDTISFDSIDRKVGYVASAPLFTLLT